MHLPRRLHEMQLGWKGMEMDSSPPGIEGSKSLFMLVSSGRLLRLRELQQHDGGGHHSTCAEIPQSKLPMWLLHHGAWRQVSERWYFCHLERHASQRRMHGELSLGRGGLLFAVAPIYTFPSCFFFFPLSVSLCLELSFPMPMAMTMNYNQEGAGEAWLFAWTPDTWGGALHILCMLVWPGQDVIPCIVCKMTSACDVLRLGW